LKASNSAASFLQTLGRASSAQKPIETGNNSQAGNDSDRSESSMGNGSQAASPTAADNDAQTRQAQVANSAVATVQLNRVARESKSAASAQASAASSSTDRSQSQSKIAQRAETTSTDANADSQAAAQQPENAQAPIVAPQIQTNTQADPSGDQGEEHGPAMTAVHGSNDRADAHAAGDSMARATQDGATAGDAQGAANSDQAVAGTDADAGQTTAQAFAAGFTFAADAAAANTFVQGVAPKVGDASSIAGKASQYKTGGATFNADAANAASGTKSSATANNAQLQAMQTSAQPAQHAQDNAAQTIAIAAKPSDSGATQAIALAAHATSGPVVSSHSASTSTSGAPLAGQEAGNLPAEQQENAAAAGTPGLNTAQLIQTMGQSEMRLGLHSAEFGDISIRTSVSQQQMQTQISVNHGGLESAISAHLPALENKLGSDYGLRTSIEVNQSGGSLSGSHQQSSQSQSAPAHDSVSQSGAERVAEMEPTILAASPYLADSGRLDIRA
jgi:hypothetical protein